MVKVEIIEQFALKDYNKVKIIKKQSSKVDLFLKGDIFECDDTMAEYLLGKNSQGLVVAKILEIIPNKPKEKATDSEDKPKKKTDKKVTQRRKKIDKEK